VLVEVELGWFAVGRAISPWTAVKVRTNSGAMEASAAFSGTLKMATYNICHGRGSDANRWPIRDKAAMMQRLRAMAEFLKSEAPDIAVLNEVDFDSVCTGRINEAAFLAGEAGFPFRVEQRNVNAVTLLFFSHRYGNAILSRHPFKSVRRVSFPGFKTWETVLGGKSDAALCDIALSPQMTVRLLATHLESRSEANRVESARIIEKERMKSPLPFLVVGDLNSTPKGFPHSQQIQGQNAMALLLDGGGYTTSPLRNPTRSDFTIVVGNPIKIVDWVLVPPSWTIVSRKVLPLSASDHCAVVVEVKVPGNAAPPKGT
jgi:endonuclease/exonuclease/phosphatase family metal-dependent hydrolase